MERPIPLLSLTNVLMKYSPPNPASHASLLTAALLAIGATAGAAETPLTLEDAFKDHFLVGTAINRSMATGAGGRRPADQPPSSWRNSSDRSMLPTWVIHSSMSL